MQVFESLKEMAARPPGRAVVAVGTFDGVHLGHAAVLGAVVRWARELGGAGAALVFSRPPRGKLGSAPPPDLVTSPEHRRRLLERLGLDFVLELDFAPRLAALDFEAFAERYLVGGFRAAGLVLGHDARLGRGGAAGFAAAQSVGARLGFEVRQMKPVEACGQTVSSSAVRRAILDGRLELAECLLGRRVSVLGTVVRGAGHGRKLGFPTVNLDIHREVRPPMGVYATLAHVEGGPALESVTNVGFRPTARGQLIRGQRRDLLVETHLLSSGGDFYGRIVEVEFVRRLREERRFESDRELAGQIARDAEEARRILAAH